MAITADLSKDALRIFKGGGFAYLVEYDAAKTILTPHCTIKTAYTAGGISLEAYLATTGVFGSTGALDVGIFATLHEENDAFSALAANVFTITALSNNHAVGEICRLYAATAYAVTDLKCFGHLAEEGSTVGDITEEEDVHNEPLDHVQTLFGKRSVSFKTNLLQSGKDELDFLLTEAREKEYAMLYAVKLKNKGHLFFAFPRVVIVPSAEYTFGGSVRKLPVTIKVLKDDVSDKYHEIYQG